MPAGASAAKPGWQAKTSRSARPALPAIAHAKPIRQRITTSLTEFPSVRHGMATVTRQSPRGAVSAHKDEKRPSLPPVRSVAGLAIERAAARRASDRISCAEMRSVPVFPSPSGWSDAVPVSASVSISCGSSTSGLLARLSESTQDDGNRRERRFRSQLRMGFAGARAEAILVSRVDQGGFMKAVRCCLAIVIAACASSQTFHTRPDKWKEPRLFHEPLDASPEAQQYKDRVRLNHDRSGVAVATRVASPNRAYWFSDQPANCEGEVRWGNRIITVFTERTSLLRLILSKADCRYAGDVRWISEKLLFVRVWWGRVLGSDLVVDVENEKLLYHELIHDGDLAFQQWRRHMNSPK